MKYITILLCLFGFLLRGQDKDKKNDSLKIYEPTIFDYQFWTEKTPKQAIDTALTIESFYKMSQYTQKDEYGKIAFPNIGQTYNQLIYQPILNNDIRLLPYGKSAKFMEIEEVRYFDVKTPITEFLYNNGMKEGHSLSSLFSHNINSQFNYTINYHGLRSLGKYLYALSVNNTFVSSVNYHTKNNKYKLWGHILFSNFNNEENAGIQTPSNFESGASNFKNRQRLLTNLQNADSEYNYKRYYIAQQYGILKSYNKDSISYYPLALKNTFSYQTSTYRYIESGTNTYYTSSLVNTADDRRDDKKFNKTTLNLIAMAQWENKLQFEGGIKWENIHFNYPYYTDTSSFLLQPDKITDSRVGVTTKLNFNWKDNLKINAQGEWMSGNFFKSTYLLHGNLYYQPIKKYSVEFNAYSISRTPSLNMLFNQSFYKDFNYYLSNFKNENITKLAGTLNIDFLKTTFSTDFININNYTYINSSYQPQQADTSTSIFLVGLKNEVTYKKFHLSTQLSFQNITSNEDKLPLPKFIGRTTLYYQSSAFKKAAEIQTGLNYYTFSKFKSRVFLPVINEYILQPENSSFEMGGFPLMDIFFNLKVKRMKITLQAQHFNSSLTGYNFYSAPNVPHLDFRLNIGIIWYILT